VSEAAPWLHRDLPLSWGPLVFLGIPGQYDVTQEVLISLKKINK
jgi:hypothetical protein